MKTSTAGVIMGAVAALSVLALAAIATVASSERQPLPIPPSRPLPIPFGVPPEEERPTVPLSAAQPSARAVAATSGTWTPLNNQPHSIYPGSVFLLTDGRILVQDSNLNAVDWWILTADNTGEYINGIWNRAASPPNCYNNLVGEQLIYSPLYYGSAVLPDGRFVMIGGEYDYDYTFVNGGDEVWTDQAAIYNPLANNWTCIAAPNSWTEIGDAQTVVLADGTFMVADPFDNEVDTLNVGTNPPTFNAPFIPPGKSADPRNDEEGWTLLPDGTVLTLEIYNTNDATETPALIYSPSLEQWSDAGSAPDPLVLQKYGGTLYDEIGPAILRPNGTVFAVGATGFNDIYDVKTGSWSRGPAFPTVTDSYSSGDCNISGVTEQLVAADAPAALLPDGNVLVAASPIDANPACGWIPPTVFFEFDGTSLTSVAAPANASNDRSYVGRLLLLPTGQVLFTDSSKVAEIYTPAGSPDPSWAPTITTSPAEVNPGGTDFELTGKQFNGLSQAVGYGDDYQAATNYPLVRITNSASKHVLYARTHNYSTMAVATGSATVSTEFDVPADIEAGPSTLVVVANGIPSQPVKVNVSTATATPTPTPNATPTPGGKIAVLANPLVFPGAGFGGAPSLKTLIVQNLNAKHALVGAVGAPIGPFAIASGGGAFKLSPLGMLKVKMTFEPTGLGVEKGSLVITSNDKNSPSLTVNLAGAGEPGVATLSAAGLTFGKVGIGIPPKTLTLKNPQHRPGRARRLGRRVAGSVCGHRRQRSVRADATGRGGLGKRSIHPHPGHPVGHFAGDHHQRSGEAAARCGNNRHGRSGSSRDQRRNRTNVHVGQRDARVRPRQARDGKIAELQDQERRRGRTVGQRRIFDRAVHGRGGRRTVHPCARIDAEGDGAVRTGGRQPCCSRGAGDNGDGAV